MIDYDNVWSCPGCHCTRGTHASWCPDSRIERDEEVHGYLEIDPEEPATNPEEPATIQSLTGEVAL